MKDRRKLSWSTACAGCLKLLEGVSLSALLLCTFPGGAALADGLELVLPLDGAVVPLLDAKQKAFLSMPYEERYEFHRNAPDRYPRGRGPKTDFRTVPLPVTLTWKGTSGPVEVTVSKIGASRPFFAETVASNSVDVWNLEIGTPYVWRVRAGSETAEGTFSTEAQAPRILRIGPDGKHQGVANFRDIGGRIVADGRRIRQGLVYRSGGLNGNAHTNSHGFATGRAFLSERLRRYMTETLGIRTDIDLRKETERMGLTCSPLGAGVKWVCDWENYYGYGRVQKDGLEQTKKIFRVLMDERNYPVVIHCAAGADRTGTVSFLLEALLGVGDDELCVDYQISSWTGGFKKSLAWYDWLLKVFDAYPGKTLSERVCGFLTGPCGFTAEEIDRIRSILLEECPYPAEHMLPCHRWLALSPEHGRIVRTGDKAAAEQVKECSLALPDEIVLPSSWPEATNIVYVTDLYWFPYMDFRALNPYTQYTVPAKLPKKPALPLTAWDRMPSDYVTVVCTSGRTGEPPPEFFLRRGFRVRLDGRDIPLKTEPSNGARKILEIAPRPRNPRNSEGDFIRLKDGTLLFAWSCFYEGGAVENASWDNGGANIVFRRSSDEGETWSSEDEMLVRNDVMNVMSVSFLRLADGRIALFYVRKLSAREAEIAMRTSSDEAKTWSDAIKASAGLPKGYYVLNNARVIQLSSGRILVPLALHREKAGGGLTSEASLVCAFSDDAGATWRAGDKVDVREADGTLVDTQEPGVVELKDGRVMMWARTSFGSQYAGLSNDGGMTWGAFGPTGLVGPRSPATVRRLKSGALVAVWNDHRLNPELVPRGRRAPLSVALSYDEGKTWQKSVPVEENLTNFFCYTALHERDDGILLAYCSKQTRNLDSIRMTFVPFGAIGEKSKMQMKQRKGE